MFFAAAQQNLFFIYTFSGEERYHHFSNAFPEFVQRIPQYMVASYLGFTPEFVSKIKTRRKPPNTSKPPPSAPPAQIT